MTASPSIELLRLSTAGSVDDGKSTLIGRLLFDSGNLYDDHIKALEKSSKKLETKGNFSLALVTDGLKAEQEQGITIDVAYRYFSTAKRRFILADTPGHEQYTRNMATGASTADVTIILVDALKGILTQTKRHAFIAALMGVPRFLVAVNKMDLVDYSNSVFERIKDEFTEFAARLGVRELRFIPVSALLGDNIITKSKQMKWYTGETVLHYLEDVYIGGDRNMVDFRFPVQQTIRGQDSYRGYAGQIASGSIHVGDEILVLPSMRLSRIKSIDTWTQNGSKPTKAEAPHSVSLVLEDEIDISRGDMIVRKRNVPTLHSRFEAMVVWMDETPMDPSRSYIIKHTTKDARVFIDDIVYRVDVNTLGRAIAEPLGLNDIGRISFTSSTPLPLDSYKNNRITGSFILIDPQTFQTSGAGMIIERRPEDTIDKKPVSRNVHWEESLISQSERESKLGYKAVTMWCTGLSGSGKSTIAKAIERKLFEQNHVVYRLDGDNLRSGLNRDLGFSPQARAENIRRAAEISKLFNQAGVSVICSFISPFKKDRELAREIIGDDRFLEIYLSTPLDACIERDPHGLYKKAMKGEISEFTGVSSPYEAPESPALSLDTSTLDVEKCVQFVLKLLDDRKT